MPWDELWLDLFPPPDAEAQRGLKALMLAPSLAVCRALLAGERVPWQLLDSVQARRYGLRQRPRSSRLSLDDFHDLRAPW